VEGSAAGIAIALRVTCSRDGGSASQGEAAGMEASQARKGICFECKASGSSDGGVSSSGDSKSCMASVPCRGSGTAPRWSAAVV
jgi:hypothetical protein